MKNNEKFSNVQYPLLFESNLWKASIAPFSNSSDVSTLIELWKNFLKLSKSSLPFWENLLNISFKICSNFIVTSFPLLKGYSGNIFNMFPLLKYILNSSSNLFSIPG